VDLPGRIGSSGPALAPKHTTVRLHQPAISHQSIDAFVLDATRRAGEARRSPLTLIDLDGGDLVARYRANYGLSAQVPVTEAMVLEHWRLERELTQELLQSSPDHRAETFERCYSELYRAVSWLREGSQQSGQQLAERALWPVLIGPPPREVYEIGSGDGSLARHLVALGYTVRATEITAERGNRREEQGLTWAGTDGVHLEAFEVPGSFDAVISNQVVEHLHPDDLQTHLRSARKLLRPGGRIAFATPHAYTGPHDISRVFGLDAPAGMHLHEYTYRELARVLREAGFVGLAAPIRLPTRVRARLGGRPRPAVSTAYLRYLIALERPLGLLHGKRRRMAASMARAALFAGNIVLVASAP
jgi:SAM-dependent methyltransferase